MLSILLIGLAIIITKIIIDIIRQHRHHPDHTFRDFMNGLLNANQKDVFTVHLGMCNNCQQRHHDYNFSDNT